MLLGAETPVAETLHRLMEEDLDRHEAVHAIGTILVSHIHDLLHGKEPPDGDRNAAYYEALRQFTAEKWREQAEWCVEPRCRITGVAEPSRALDRQ